MGSQLDFGLGVSLFLISAFFGSAAIEKAVSLARRRVALASFPILRISPLTRRVPRVSLAAGGMIEALVAIMLLVRPLVGLLYAVALLLAYTFILRRLDPRQACGCYSLTGRTQSAARARRRNLILIPSFGLIALLILDGHSPNLSQAAIGAAAIAGAVALALIAIQRLEVQTTTTNSEVTLAE